MHKLTSLLILLLLIIFTQQGVESAPPNDCSKYWIFFKNKASEKLSKSSHLYKQAKSHLTTRALSRRAKVRTVDNLVDQHDLPVRHDYLEQIQSMGGQPLVVSNWLNAVSACLDSEQIEAIKALPFVKKIQPVARARRKQPFIYLPDELTTQPNATQENVYNYGSSLTQNQIINTTAVHSLGITGKSVWIGMLDTGFKYRGHEVFENLHVIAEYDFINHDGITENQPGQDVPSQHQHGTQTLSTVGGFKEGQLIGTGFGASFLLAKTEDITQEVTQEEDNWVAGIEWLENQGVDVVTSSLGYLDFYTPNEMDGNTAVTTIAADLAVNRGVVVLNSAGNERNGRWHIIISPADGDSVIAVGAVDRNQHLSSFSSVGPTADGRIKPEVVAMGSSVYTAVPSDDDPFSTYRYTGGTSFSCPAVAGVAALILSAHPYLTPMEVRDALLSTADRANSPDTLFGWGIVNALEAVLFHGTAFSNLPDVSVNTNEDLEISIKIASKTGLDSNQIYLIYAGPDNQFNQTVLMSQGSEPNQFVATIPGVSGNEMIQFYFSSQDLNGLVSLHPHNAPDSTFTVNKDGMLLEIKERKMPSNFHLVQNYPNPAAPSTTIDFDLPQSLRVSLTVYNILGQQVRVLLKNQMKPAGRNSVFWDGSDAKNLRVPAGLYFYQLKSDNVSIVKKMLVVR